MALRTRTNGSLAGQLLIALTTLLALAAPVIPLTSSELPDRGLAAVISFLVVAAPLGVGVYARRVEHSRFGTRLVLLGIGLFIGDAFLLRLEPALQHRTDHGVGMEVAILYALRLSEWAADAAPGGSPFSPPYSLSSPSSSSRRFPSPTSPLRHPGAPATRIARRASSPKQRRSHVRQRRPAAAAIGARDAGLPRDRDRARTARRAREPARTNVARTRSSGSRSCDSWPRRSSCWCEPSTSHPMSSCRSWR